MIHNLGDFDRIARIVLGLGLLSLLMFASGGWKWLGLIGIVPLLTALAGWCPAYSLLGVKSCPTEEK
jgi:hypothetical protein